MVEVQRGTDVLILKEIIDSGEVLRNKSGDESINHGLIILSIIRLDETIKRRRF